MTTEQPDLSTRDPARTRRILLTGASLVAVTGVALWAFLGSDAPGPKSRSAEVPDFSTMTDVREKKQAFFEFLAPMVDSRNAWIMEQRLALLELQEQLAAGATPDRQQQALVAELAERYRVTVPETGIDAATVKTLLRRCDQIPPSLALAQAASESAWGTSRFAREGNNYFGEWCFNEGCGMVPSRRGPNQTHEVETFDAVEDAVDSYFRNLNRVDAYADLRAVRARARIEDRPLTGPLLAGGLMRYSERGQEYIDDLRSIISFNKLETRFELDGDAQAAE